MNSMNTVNIVNAADDAGGLKENKRKKEFVFSGKLPNTDVVSKILMQFLQQMFDTLMQFSATAA